MIPRIKICGVNTSAAMEAAIAAHIDYAGLVFFARSPRHVEAGTARQLAALSGDSIRRTGLFVDAGDEAIAEGVAAGKLSAIQLHGHETPERAAALRARFGIAVWKALPIAGPDDIARARDYTGAVDMLLFDAKTPVGQLPGGMGLRFDWSLVHGYDGAVPWGLAGGLSPANVADAIAEVRPALVDVSSGVESAPGVKDAAAIAAFARAVRTR
ncbi:phosphoribosylanthranilate isomerase [Croceicoccus hydrothermalis]|uniref:phosphoribosylanthranilate isomerase n=1 Tax=Croceicoccus hydrothermalis TaxID=2867964 RepID=UPI001EFB93D7|nr:phosphoribosylanthranilate isomerase [Croceicoccus hydrothermalis]